MTLNLKPETIALLKAAIARCDKAQEYLTSAIAHDKQVFIDEMQNADRCLCQAVGSLIEGEK